MIGMNEYTFQKIVFVNNWCSFADYVRSRRLSNAGQNYIWVKKKIVDIAVKYQYNNATSFF